MSNLQAIAPTPAKAAGYSLLLAAQVVTDLSVAPDPPEQSEAEEWQLGVEWAPEQLNGGFVTGVDCHGGWPDAQGDNIPDNPTANTAEPFAVVAGDKCSTFGFKGRDWIGRARRQLLATRSFQIAQELQLGALRDSVSLANVALKDADELTSSPATPLHALAALEFASGRAYGGRAAMIHVDLQVLTLLVAQHVLTLSGQKWLTPSGNVVAADAGYGLESGEHFMYATLPVVVRLSDVIVVPGDDDAARAQATDRATNLTTVFATELALVTFDNGVDDAADAMFKQPVDVDLDVEVS